MTDDVPRDLALSKCQGDHVHSPNDVHPQKTGQPPPPLGPHTRTPGKTPSSARHCPQPSSPSDLSPSRLSTVAQHHSNCPSCRETLFQGSGAAGWVGDLRCPLLATLDPPPAHNPPTPAQGWRSLSNTTVAFRLELLYPTATRRRGRTQPPPPQATLHWPPTSPADFERGGQG